MINLDGFNSRSKKATALSPSPQSPQSSSPSLSTIINIHLITITATGFPGRRPLAGPGLSWSITLGCRSKKGNAGQKVGLNWLLLSCPKSLVRIIVTHGPVVEAQTKGTTNKRQQPTAAPACRMALSYRWTRVNILRLVIKSKQRNKENIAREQN